MSWCGESDPINSSPDGLFGHALVDLMKLGSKLIVVDPRVTWIAAHAENHLQLRPGTEYGPRLGWLMSLLPRILYNKEFVDKWCYGFDDFAEWVEDWTPERAGEVCWVDPRADSWCGTCVCDE